LGKAGFFFWRSARQIAKNPLFCGVFPNFFVRFNVAFGAECALNGKEERRRRGRFAEPKFELAKFPLNVPVDRVERLGS
jgi:hypothetical protein